MRDIIELYPTYWLAGILVLVTLLLDFLLRRIRRRMEIRIIASAGNPGDSFNLQCEIRERALEFIRTQHPECLPRLREEMNLLNPTSSPHTSAEAKPE
ncbi:MAG: hypothetical protein SFV32_02850 [Opitutaceae bacterium]|nr:hypothetical protein [Opitutaceae bacterium]